MPCWRWRKNGAAASDGEPVFALAAQHAQAELDRLGVGDDAAQLFQRLAGALLYADASLRSPPEVLTQGIGGPPALWACGISGDRPIVLVAHPQRWFAGSGAPVVVRASLVGEPRAGGRPGRHQRGGGCASLAGCARRPGAGADDAVRQECQSQENHFRAARRSTRWSYPGRSTDCRADRAERRSRQHVAQVGAARLAVANGRSAARLEAAAPDVSAPTPRLGRVAADLEFFNGLGGFADGGREYVTVLPPGQSTPAPWLNVIANPEFGFSATAEGGGYTWAVNSQQNPQTPWGNDPVSDTPSEAIYLRDRDTRRRVDAYGITGARARLVGTSRGMGRATAASSTRHTVSKRSCCSTCRWPMRSKYRA